MSLLVTSIAKLPIILLSISHSLAKNECTQIRRRAQQKTGHFPCRPIPAHRELNKLYFRSGFMVFIVYVIAPETQRKISVVLERKNLIGMLRSYACDRKENPGEREKKRKFCPHEKRLMQWQWHCACPHTTNWRWRRERNLCRTCLAKR